MFKLVSFLHEFIENDAVLNHYLTERQKNG
jgi:hypothetical protein